MSKNFNNPSKETNINQETIFGFCFRSDLVGSDECGKWNKKSQELFMR